MRLTNNEKKVLEFLSENARLSDVGISKKLKVSPQAVGKIRKKLEKRNIITGYSCSVNYGELGEDIFVLSFVKFREKFWRDLKKNKNKDLLEKNIPNLVFSCMPLHSDVSLITVHAFRNIKEMEEYFYSFKSRTSEYFEIANMCTFSFSSIKSNPQELLKLIMNANPAARAKKRRG